MIATIGISNNGSDLDLEITLIAHDLAYWYSSTAYWVLTLCADNPV